jgi:hypothetical protein
MKRGRVPKPVAQKIIEGNPGGRPLNLSEPEGVGEIGDPPSGWPDELKKIWHEIVFFAPVGVLKGSDRQLVETTCLHLHRMRSTMELSPSQSGELRKCLGLLGMTPGDRARLSVPKKTPANPFGAMKSN